MRVIKTIEGAQQVVREYLTATEVDVKLDLYSATGGYIYEVETFLDMLELPDFETVEYVDKLKDGSYFIYQVSNDSGGNSYHIPKKFVTSEITNIEGNSK